MISLEAGSRTGLSKQGARKSHESQIIGQGYLLKMQSHTAARRVAGAVLEPSA